MKAINIKWDTDGDVELFNTLPSTIKIPNDMTNEDDISNYLSDTIGYCHNGFELINENDDTNNKLVKAISNSSTSEIENFLGYPNTAETLEELEDEIREVLNQMSNEEIQKVKDKYNIE